MSKKCKCCEWSTKWTILTLTHFSLNKTELEKISSNSCKLHIKTKTFSSVKNLSQIKEARYEISISIVFLKILILKPLNTIRKSQISGLTE